jgi:hypothetical protein
MHPIGPTEHNMLRRKEVWYKKKHRQYISYAFRFFFVDALKKGPVEAGTDKQGVRKREGGKGKLRVFMQLTLRKAMGVYKYRAWMGTQSL